jgi:HEAT repeat protein
VAKFVAFMLALAVFAGAAAFYSQRMGFTPFRAATPIQPPRQDGWLDNLYSKNPRDEEAAKKEVRELGANALPAIRAVLADPAADVHRRKAALKACGVLEHTAAPVIPEVTGSLTDPEVTEEAAMALSFMGSAAFGPLREGFGNDDPVVRRESLRSIGKLKSRAPLTGKAVVPLLVAGMVDDVPSVRVVAATYLGIIHEQPEESVPPLIAALEDPDMEVRRAAATALGSFGEAAESAIPALRKAAGDSDPDLAREAGRSLIKLQSREDAR